jgi:hypothetical protein
VGFIAILLKLESFSKEIMAFLLRSIAYKGGVISGAKGGSHMKEWFTSILLVALIVWIVFDVLV